MFNNTVTNKISLSPASITLVLGAVAFILVVASLAGQLAPYYTERNEPVVFLSLDGEQNLPAFFSVLLLLVASLLLTVVTLFKKVQGAPYTLYWAVLAFGFLFMALDEATSIHEKLHGPMSWLLGEERPAAFHFAWVVPGIAIVLFMGLFFLKFLLRLPAKTRWLFLAAGSVYLGGAIVLELVGGYYASVHGINNWAFIVTSSIEEGFEMAGVIVFIFALLGYMAETFGEVRIGFNVRERVQEKQPADLKVTPVSLTGPAGSPRPRRPEIVSEPVSNNIREPAVTP